MEAPSKRAQTKGACGLCGKSFSRTGMLRHLDNCLLKHQPPLESAKSKKGVYFHLRVTPPYGSDFWLHLHVRADTTLAQLDRFLRDIWLECCGHLSMFEIGSQRYYSYAAREMEGRTMKYPLSRVLVEGMNCQYEYDFGTTTELSIKVVSVRESLGSSDPIVVLARNDPPALTCVECGAPATLVCTQCSLEEGEGFYCDECAEEHACGEEMMLPVVNSPRMGVCGYTGGEW